MKAPLQQRWSSRTSERIESCEYQVHWELHEQKVKVTPTKMLPRNYSNQDNRVTRLKELKHVNLRFNWSAMDRKWKFESERKFWWICKVINTSSVENSLEGWTQPELHIFFGIFANQGDVYLLNLSTNCEYWFCPKVVMMRFV